MAYVAYDQTLLDSHGKRRRKNRAYRRGATGNGKISDVTALANLKNLGLEQSK